MSERVKDVLVNQVFILKQVQVKQDLQHDYILKAGKQKALTIPVHSTAPAATSSVVAGRASVLNRSVYSTQSLQRVLSAPSGSLFTCRKGATIH